MVEEIQSARIYLREQKRILTQLHEGAEREKQLQADYDRLAEALETEKRWYASSEQIAEKLRSTNDELIAQIIAMKNKMESK